MRLVTVGCSGSFAGPDSPASAYLVQVPAAISGDGRDWNIVLDLGNGGFGALQRFIDPLALDAVFISHLHPDHFVDLCGLYVYLRYQPVRAGSASATSVALPVWGPPGTQERMAATYGLDPGEPMAALGFRVWQDRAVAQVGPLRIEAFAMRHPVETYGVRITGPSSVHGAAATLAYTGDTDSCPAAVELARGADLLLAEAAFLDGRDDHVVGVHLTGRRAGDLAAQAKVRRLVLTHIPAWNDPERTRAAAGEVFTGPIDVATTGAEFWL